jgi:integrase
MDHLDRYVDGEPASLFFTGEKGGPVRPHVLQKTWSQARMTIGIEAHLHDLRHAGNTWAAATGASTKELMGHMGHANAAAALRYQHATADRDQAIARARSELKTPRKRSRWRAKLARPRDGRAMEPPKRRRTGA